MPTSWSPWRKKHGGAKRDYSINPATEAEEAAGLKAMSAAFGRRGITPEQFLPPGTKFGTPRGTSSLPRTLSAGTSPDGYSPSRFSVSGQLLSGPSGPGGPYSTPGPIDPTFKRPDFSTIGDPGILEKAIGRAVIDDPDSRDRHQFDGPSAAYPGLHPEYFIDPNKPELGVKPQYATTFQTQAESRVGQKDFNVPRDIWVGQNVPKGYEVGGEGGIGGKGTTKIAGNWLSDIEGSEPFTITNQEITDLENSALKGNPDTLDGLARLRSERRRWLQAHWEKSIGIAAGPGGEVAAESYMAEHFDMQTLFQKDIERIQNAFYKSLPGIAGEHLAKVGAANFIEILKATDFSKLTEDDLYGIDQGLYVVILDTAIDERTRQRGIEAMAHFDFLRGDLSAKAYWDLPEAERAAIRADARRGARPNKAMSVFLNVDESLVEKMDLSTFDIFVNQMMESNRVNRERDALSASRAAILKGLFPSMSLDLRQQYRVEGQPLSSGAFPDLGGLSSEAFKLLIQQGQERQQRGRRGTALSRIFPKYSAEELGAMPESLLLQLFQRESRGPFRAPQESTTSVSGINWRVD